jgi:SulP family sulfate permease
MRGRQLVHGLHLGNLRGDIYGGVTAAVVALPLALAFGVASGAGPVAGMYGAVFVGLFAALFGGTPAQVSGPTGPMTVVMAGVLTRYAHEPAMAFTVVVMAGLLQIGFGLMRLGRYINLMPYPVLSGFMSGIGCIIIILELAPLAGHENPGGGPLAALVGAPSAFAAANGDALVIGLVALAIGFAWPARANRIIPAPLLALGVGVALAAYLLTNAPVLGEIPTGFPVPRLPTFDLVALPGMVQSALVLAFLGSIDSLLTSLVADNVTQTRHESDRELIGQGIGNAIAGLMGAIPGAGATMRTVVNVRAGGRTPISGALHALLLLGVLLGLGRYAKSIPHAALAGILLKVGYDIIDWTYLRQAHRAPRAGVVFMLVVLVLTVFVDLITAVAVGVVMASLLFVKRMADLQIESVREIVEPSDAVAFTERETGLLARCRGRARYVHLGGPLRFMDSSAALAFGGVLTHAEAHGRHAFIVGMRPRVEDVLVRLQVLSGIGARPRFDSIEAALLRAVEIVEAAGPGSGEVA